MREAATPGGARGMAIQWWLRLTSGHATEADRAACHAWRNDDPAHELAWRQLERGVSQSVGKLPLSLRRADGPLRQTLVSPSRRRVLLAAAGITTTAAGAWTLNAQVPLAGLVADLRTGTAERRAVALPDGTVLTLDARSRVDLDFSAGKRAVRLLAGAVIADLTSGSEPAFAVHTQHGQVRSPDARYMVRLEADATLAVVLRGRAEVLTRQLRTVALRSGDGTRFGEAWIDAPSRSLVHTTAWRNGWLEVHDQPLHKVVADLDRYHPGLLRLSPDAAEIRVSGLYPLDDPQRALSALAHTTPIVLRRYSRWVTVIEAARA
jgi:transmembrane sensor